MVTDLAKSFEDAGVAAIIYTDINRDGAMQGPNVQATADLAHAVSIPVIYGWCLLNRGSTGVEILWCAPNGAISDARFMMGRLIWVKR